MQPEYKSLTEKYTYRLLDLFLYCPIAYDVSILETFFLFSACHSSELFKRVGVDLWGKKGYLTWSNVDTGGQQ